MTSAPPLAPHGPRTFRRNTWSTERSTGGMVARVLLPVDETWKRPTPPKGRPVAVPTVWQRVTAVRDTLGLTMIELGKELGVSRQAVYKWEHESKPEQLPEERLNRLYEIAKAFKQAGVQDAKHLVRRAHFEKASLLDLCRRGINTPSHVTALLEVEARMQSEYDALRPLRPRSAETTQDNWKTYLSIPSADEDG